MSYTTSKKGVSKFILYEDTDISKQGEVCSNFIINSNIKAYVMCFLLSIFFVFKYRRILVYNSISFTNIFRDSDGATHNKSIGIHF